MYLLYPSLQKGKNDLNEMNIFFNENNVMLEIKWDGGTEKFKSVGKYFKICTSIKMITIFLILFFFFKDGNKITAGKWTFIGITVDGIENKTTIHVNEEYGWTDPDDANYDGRKVHFDITNFEAMADVFKSTIRIGKRGILLIQSVLGEKLGTGPFQFFSIYVCHKIFKIFSFLCI